jgi:hypothetical protein
MGEFVATFDPSRTDWSLPAEWFPSLLAIFALVTASNFCAAAILSRFASTSEINGCAPLIALLIAYWFIYPFVARFLWGMDWQWIVAGAVIAPLTYLFPMLVGGAIARRPATV